MPKIRERFSGGAILDAPAAEVTLMLTADARAIALLYEERPDGIVGMRVTPSTEAAVFSSAHVALWIARRTERGYEASPVMTRRRELPEVADVLERMFKG